MRACRGRFPSSKTPSTQVTWFETSRAPPAWGTFCRPCMRMRYMIRVARYKTHREVQRVATRNETTISRASSSRSASAISQPDQMTAMGATTIPQIIPSPTSWQSMFTPDNLQRDSDVDGTGHRPHPSLRWKVGYSPAPRTATGTSRREPHCQPREVPKAIAKTRPCLPACDLRGPESGPVVVSQSSSTGLATRRRSIAWPAAIAPPARRRLGCRPTSEINRVPAKNQ